MSFDDWGMKYSASLHGDNLNDWGEDPEWGHNNDWVENQKIVELVFDILVHTSDKAYLLQFGERDVWFSKSKATINMSMHKNTVRIPRWIMREKGLEEYCTDESVVQEKTEVEELFNKVVRKNIRKLEDDIPF
jgi:hypothetical protein